ncbi:maleylpyruvate isomerase family mycothiol-dependent enzyme [Streptomyces sp. NPDC127074]|uniref:maleylpyruvate isomerase family mycothiol-dependent enzyme n=1 Tax=Streptomyces sp. NPDC127074 TaxID=3347130 RepID=UPI00364650B8
MLRHLGGTHRWAEETVRTRATGALPDQHFRDLSPSAEEDAAEVAAEVAPWLVEGAELLAETLRDAGPDAELWTPVPDFGQVAGGRADFYARRFTHETALHRADAALALGEEYTLDQEVALDGLDECRTDRGSRSPSGSRKAAGPLGRGPGRPPEAGSPRTRRP